MLMKVLFWLKGRRERREEGRGRQKTGGEGKGDLTTNHEKSLNRRCVLTASGDSWERQKRLGL